MYTLTKVTFKNLDSREVNNFILWFEDLADRLEITVCYENHIIDALVCDFSFDISNFKINEKTNLSFIFSGCSSLNSLKFCNAFSNTSSLSSLTFNSSSKSISAFVIWSKEYLFPFASSLASFEFITS